MAHSLAQDAIDQATARMAGDGHSTPVSAPRGEPPEEHFPRPFGRYVLQRLLGRGAMGSVYLAHDSNLDRLVALKIPRPLEEDPTVWRDRFLSEARAAATLHHPNICPVFEVSENESQLFLTMAYIEGETLAARLRRTGPLPLAEAAALVRKLSRAMAEAHERGIVHRDLKPANIMLDRRQEPVIMDFGLALRAAASDDLRLTLSGVAMGTPCYMPPEQAGGDHAAIGPSADVYSLGVILFELVTGQVPFQGRTFGKLLAQIERDPAPSPQSINPAVDGKLADVILKSLAKVPQERFASAGQLADALDAYLATASQPLAETAEWSGQASRTKKPAARPSQGRRTWFAGACGLAAIAVLGVLMYVVTDNGTLVVELSDPAAQVDIKVNGKEVVLDPQGNSVRIRAGANQRLEVSGPDYEIAGESFSLKRGKKTVVQVTLVPKGAVPPPGAVSKKLPPTKAPPTPEPAVPLPPGLIDIPGWHLVTGANQEQMRSWLKERKKSKHSVMWLDSVLIGEEPVFAATAALDGRASDWEAFLDLTSQEVNDVEVLSKRLDPARFVVTSIGGYVKDKSLTGVALYHRGKADGLAGIPMMPHAKLQMSMAMSNGYVARAIRPVTTAGDQLLCGMYAEGAIDTRSRHAFEWTEAEMTKKLEIQREEGAYPVSVVPYETGGKRQFAATFREDPTKSPWELTRDVTAEELKTKGMENARKGMIPVSITVYPHNGEARYCVVWREESRGAQETAGTPDGRPQESRVSPPGK